MVARKGIELPEKRNTRMLIDTHCHVDQFPSPETVVQECESRGIHVVAVTNLPSHFALAADRLRNSPFVRPALGIHPLSAVNGVRELGAFKRMAPHTNYIGEIGLDFSPHGKLSKAIQERIFEEILNAIKDRPRFITIHSRGAEKAVLQNLRRYQIHGAVFHWFSGSARDFDEAIADGHFVSVNPSMFSSISGKKVIENAPKECLLVESDAPFTKIRGKSSHPKDIAVVYHALAAKWQLSLNETEKIIASNFNRITKQFEK